jgi:alpha-D-xyloside xylohydrolase
MAVAASTGLPVMRPMFVDFPEDPACWDCEDQFMFGSDFLVAPITEAGSLARKVYLPKGQSWKSVWDHSQTYEGGQTVVISEPFSRFPVLVPKDSAWSFSLKESSI